MPTDSEGYLLEATGVRKTFGAVTAVEDVTVGVKAGNICGLIGPNGSGKTTLFHCISGFLPMNEGSIRFNGQDITGKRPHKLAQLGVVRTFQHVMMFPEQTVIEGIRRAQMCSGRRLRRLAGREGGLPQKAEDLVEFAGLAEFAHANVGAAPYGIQRLTNVVMALAAQPEILMLDEPVAGLHPEESHHLASLLQDVRSQGTTVFIIDHNMPFLMPLCDYIYVLDAGQNLFAGAPDVVQASEDVARVYLGEQANTNVTMAAAGGEAQ